MANPTWVLVVDDFEPFRNWAARLVGEELAQPVVEAKDGLEAVEKARECRANLIILDIGLPKLNGIEAARQILDALPDSRIIFLSQENSAEVVLQAMHLGAFAYVAKARAGTDLLSAVREVQQGKKFVSNGFAAEVYREVPLSRVG
jgi:DNA-binding NarL/FixJ family response regulator